MLKNTETAMITEADNVVLAVCVVRDDVFVQAVAEGIAHIYIVVRNDGNVVVHAHSAVHVYNVVQDGFVNVHSEKVVHNDSVFTLRALIML